MVYPIGVFGVNFIYLCGCCAEWMRILIMVGYWFVYFYVLDQVHICTCLYLLRFGFVGKNVMILFRYLLWVCDVN